MWCTNSWDKQNVSIPPKNKFCVCKTRKQHQDLPLRPNFDYHIFQRILFLFDFSCKFDRKLPRSFSSIADVLKFYHVNFESEILIFKKWTSRNPAESRLIKCLIFYILAFLTFENFSFFNLITILMLSFFLLQYIPGIKLL